MSRWADVLQHFEFIVKYRPGACMQHIDALSRAPVDSGNGTEVSVDTELSERWEVYVVLSPEE